MEGLSCSSALGFLTVPVESCFCMVQPSRGSWLMSPSAHACTVIFEGAGVA